MKKRILLWLALGMFVGLCSVSMSKASEKGVIFQGASIRTTAEQGIRFCISVSDASHATECGMRVTYKGKTITVSTENEAYRNIYAYDAETDTTQYTVVVYGIPESEFDNDFTVQGFAKYGEGASEEVIFTTEEARSVSYVAEHARYEYNSSLGTWSKMITITAASKSAGTTATTQDNGSMTVDFTNDYDSVYVALPTGKTGADYGSVTVNVTASEQFGLSLVDSSKGTIKSSYPGYGLSGSTSSKYTIEFDTVDKDVTKTFADGVYLRFMTLKEINGAAAAHSSITIHDIKFNRVKDSSDVVNNYESLAELAQERFKMGTVVSYEKLSDTQYMNFVKKHYNSITAANEMKAYSLLSQTGCQTSEDGTPVMDYTKADAMMEFAKENGIHVRGHVLVWDAYMCDWFFRTDYQSDGAYVNQETMKLRLKSYIEQVIDHFETEYPGVIYCWDVVNEAVADSTSECDSSDERMVRTLRGGTENQFYNIIGSDYVELSFLYAKNKVEELQKTDSSVDIKLFYNDYNTIYSAKRSAIIKLITSINSYAQDKNGDNRKLCDGVGMQSYLGGYGVQEGCMNASLIDMSQEAIRAFSALGVEVHVTELAARNYQNDDATMAQHATFCKNLYSMYKEVNSNYGANLTSVSMWGIVDDSTMNKEDYSYKMNGPYCGLLDEYYGVKQAFKNVYDVFAVDYY